jgi:uncharacterized integral membrane protein
MINLISSEPTVYQGQFSSFTVTKEDRMGVIFYRLGLLIMAICISLATTFALKGIAINSLTPLFYIFTLALGLSLFQIHIYFTLLHNFLKISWLIGTTSAIYITVTHSTSLVEYLFQNPLYLFGVGFLFVSLTGIYFKEAFCFNRLETKFLTPLVPFLFLGHLSGLLSSPIEQILLILWGVLFILFVVRKVTQNVDQDLGDLSVFAYLKEQRT